MNPGKPEHRPLADNERLEARRSFLRWMGAGIAAPAGATWLPGAVLGDGPQDPDPVADDLRKAWNRAQSHGKAMLVALIPFERGKRKEFDFLVTEEQKKNPKPWPAWPPYSERGARLGRSLRLLDDQAMAAIGTTEFVCADELELRALIRSVRKEDDRPGRPTGEIPDAAMLLVETDGTVSVVVDKIPERENVAGGRGVFGDVEAQKRLREVSQKVADDLGREIRSRLFGDGAESSRRLARHVSSLGASRVEFETARSGSDADVRRCSLVFHFRGTQVSDAKERARFQKRLADLTRKSLLEGDFVGARWGSSGGCGSDYVHPRKDDGTGGMGIACGMGFVTDVDRRFLGFRVR